MLSSENLILLSDAYKYGHHEQYPPGTTEVYSYFEARSGATHDEIVFFGTQYFLSRYLSGQVVTREKIDEAAELIGGVLGEGGFYREGWEHILKEHGGRLPIEIWAIPEGSVVSPGTPMLAIRNTDPKCWWLTNFLETLLSHLWYPSTVATVSRELRKELRHHLTNTGCEDTSNVLQFMLHDFGCRGVSSMESAGLGGAAHLLSFRGTDTIPGVKLLKDYYRPLDEFVGGSVVATEHSTMTSWGEGGELDAYRNVLERNPDSVVSIVSDSWDLYNAAENLFGIELHDLIVNRNGRTVIRPDSGDPIETNLKLIEILGKKFGFTKNYMGYKVLPDYLRILQGDGMTPESIRRLLFAAKDAGWAAENWVLGMGGGLLQRGLDRDTERFAFKCSHVVVNGEGRDVFKRPATDPSKNSKRGYLHENMDDVFRDGYLTNSITLKRLRGNALS